MWVLLQQARRITRIEDKIKASTSLKSPLHRSRNWINNLRRMNGTRITFGSTEIRPACLFRERHADQRSRIDVRSSSALWSNGSGEFDQSLHSEAKSVITENNLRGSLAPEFPIWFNPLGPLPKGGPNNILTNKNKEIFFMSTETIICGKFLVE